MDFSQFHSRKVALLIRYFGWDFVGFSAQKHMEQARTIEGELLSALRKIRLIDNLDDSSMAGAVCGRTDKGVSGFRVVYSLTVRSRERVDKSPSCPPSTSSAPSASSKVCRTVLPEPSEEINYVQVLNKVLPREIRILAWSPVDEEFNSRFDCKKRTYKYFFSKGDLDLEAMSSSASKLIGTHDFRNFCKVDLCEARLNGTFIRRIFDCRVELCCSREAVGGAYDMNELIVSASGFLWHQIRYIMSVLLLVGRGLEQPSVVDRLLDVDTVQAMPNFAPASQLPLCFFDSEFDESAVKWHLDKDTLATELGDLQMIWSEFQTKAQMVRAVIVELEALTDLSQSQPLSCQNDGLLKSEKHFRHRTTGVKSTKSYVPLLQRQSCGALK